MHGKVFDEYVDEDVVVTGERQEQHGDYTVQTRIVANRIEAGRRKDVADVDYRLRQKDNRWRIIDITIDGVSMAVNYRAISGNHGEWGHRAIAKAAARKADNRREMIAAMVTTTGALRLMSSVRIASLFAMIIIGFFSGCSSTPGDPLEHINRSTYWFNDELDRKAIKPATDVYVKVVPLDIRIGIGNAFREPLLSQRDRQRFPPGQMGPGFQRHRSDGGQYNRRHRRFF